VIKLQKYEEEVEQVKQNKLDLEKEIKELEEKLNQNKNFI